MTSHALSPIVTRRAGLAFALLALVASSLAMLIVEVAEHAALFNQPRARVFVMEPVCALIVYALAIVFIARVRGERWDVILKNAVTLGLISGTIEIVNIGIENGVPFSVHAPFLSIGSMLVVFTTWGIAGFRTARSLHSLRAGLIASVLAAAICLLIAVTAGFTIEFFVAPPAPAYVSTWAEFKRSGWTDAGAFGLAETLDSGFTHLVMAPIVALLFGGVAAWLARLEFSKPSAINL